MLFSLQARVSFEDFSIPPLPPPLQFTSTIDSLLTGNTLAKTGNTLAKTGNTQAKIAKTGNTLAKTGNTLAKTGNTLAKTGNTHAKTGNTDAKTGNTLSKTHAKTGNTDASRNIKIHTGNNLATSSGQLTFAGSPSLPSVAAVSQHLCLT